MVLTRISSIFLLIIDLASKMFITLNQKVFVGGSGCAGVFFFVGKLFVGNFFDGKILDGNFFGGKIFGGKSFSGIFLLGNVLSGKFLVEMFLTRIYFCPHFFCCKKIVGKKIGGKICYVFFFIFTFKSLCQIIINFVVIFRL